jgi:hypothetical protein
MRAGIASDKDPYPVNDVAAQLEAIGDRGYALAAQA